MNLFGLSPGELFLIMFVAMIVLGPEKLPETAASIGKWIREFRRAVQELTQQFADDNPFAEIQRALNFNEEPPIAAPATEVVEAAPIAVLEAPPPPTVVAPYVAPAAVVPRSDYFDRPSLFEPIDDRWAHGSLEDFAERVLRRLKPQIELAIADEWAHGVPVVAIVAPSEPISSNGHAEDTVADAFASFNFASALNSTGERVESSPDADMSPPIAATPNIEPDALDPEPQVEEPVAIDAVADFPEPSTVPSANASDVEPTAPDEGTSDEHSAVDEPPRVAPTAGISVSSVMARDSKPVAVGSKASSGSDEDGSSR